MFTLYLNPEEFHHPGDCTVSVFRSISITRMALFVSTPAVCSVCSLPSPPTTVGARQRAIFTSVILFEADSAITCVR